MTATMGPNISVQATIQGVTFDMSAILGGIDNFVIVGWNCAPNSMVLKYLPRGCQ